MTSLTPDQLYDGAITVKEATESKPRRFGPLTVPYLIDTPIEFRWLKRAAAQFVGHEHLIRFVRVDVRDNGENRRGIEIWRTNVNRVLARR
jgi:ribosomal 30S subunit maturation factor RimM